MFSKVITTIFAVNCIFVVSGFVAHVKLRVLEPVLECYQNFERNENEEKIHRDAITKESINMACSAMEKFNSCVTSIIKATPAPVPKVFLFYGVVAFQTSVLFKRASLCPGIKYDDLRNIVFHSGVIQEEELSNIENDPYEQCAGDALEKCVTQDVNFEHDVDLKKEEYSYDACMKKQAETCSGAMMRHLMKQVEAEKEHVKKLIGLEELEGKKVLH